MSKIFFNFLFIFLLTKILTAQNNDLFGKLSHEEKELTEYKMDPRAHAVVLYEVGNNYFEVIDRKILLVKEYHTKIKILDEEGYDNATITLPAYKNKTSTEKYVEIKAVTHNGENQSYVLPSEIFHNEVNEHKNETIFTFPKLEKGSIIEYSYKMTSPFIYNFNGWDFQSNIPKIYSEFNAKIPGNYLYNRALVGDLKLSTNEASIKKHCFYIEGYPNPADCEILKYVMKDIPAFKSDEEFMLGESNYKSRIDFELSELKRFNGVNEKFTKTWKDVDKEFRFDKDVGRQLTKTDFFENNVPNGLLTKDDKLERAKAVYKFIQKHYNWNGDYGIYGKARVKEAFEEKSGNVGEINMSLINLLNASGLKTDLMLLSTRNNGLPKRTHPVMSDFNYSIAKTNINGIDYLLDATDKYIPFGYLPFRALNHYGRVMDFKNESYWYSIIAKSENKYSIRVFAQFDLENKKTTGALNISATGYDAVKIKKVLESKPQDEYLTDFEEEIGEDFSVLDYKVDKKNSNDYKFLQRLKFEMKNNFQGQTIYFNPFMIKFFEKNPFILEKRAYPIDFGYSRNYNYQLIFAIPEGYSLKSLPESRLINFGENDAQIKMICQEQNNRVSITFDFNIIDTHLASSNYEAIKAFFNDAVNIQNNTLLVFTKN